MSDSAFAIEVTEGGEPLLSQRFDQDCVTVGRSAECDLTIDRKVVSRCHFEIRRRGRMFALLAHPTANGTNYGGRVVEGLVAFNPDLKIFLSEGLEVRVTPEGRRRQFDDSDEFELFSPYAKEKARSEVFLEEEPTRVRGPHFAGSENAVASHLVLLAGAQVGRVAPVEQDQWSLLGADDVEVARIHTRDQSHFEIVFSAEITDELFPVSVTARSYRGAVAIGLRLEALPTIVPAEQ